MDQSRDRSHPLNQLSSGPLTELWIRSGRLRHVSFLLVSLGVYKIAGILTHIEKSVCWDRWVLCTWGFFTQPSL